MRRLILLSALLGIATGVSPAIASETNVGENLHQQQCLSCHDQTVYTRPRHHVTNLNTLTQQVKRCEVPATAKWTNEEVTSVVNYLNSQFYHFPTP